MINYPQRIFSWLIDSIFPKTCLGCGEFTYKNDFNYVCRGCFSGIKVKKTFECIGCKRESKFGLTCALCVKENKIDQLIIATELSDTLVDRMIKIYKYSFVRDMENPLTLLATKCIKNLLGKGFNLFEDNPLFVPVPLLKRRFNWRGFNQAELIVKKLSDTYHMSLGSNLLFKISGSKHQADIEMREERLLNVKNNFEVRDKNATKDRVIILIDDICTTGATLNECARVLKENGAKKIIGLVIARG